MFAAMEIHVATLCDSAMDYNGKLCVLGTFSTLGSRTLPVIHRGCALALRVCFRTADEGKHTLTIRMIDADGKDVIPPPQMPFEVRLGADVEFDVRNIILQFEALKFDKDGNYSIEIAVDGQELVSIPLRVIYVPNQG